MRSYMVEEIDPQHLERLADSMRSKDMASAVDGIFWMDVPESLYSDEQEEHAAQCGPYSMALEIGEDWLKLELLVRARSRVRCSCVAYATPPQRAHMVERVDSLLHELDIPV
jgi:hypothetical protein